MTDLLHDPVPPTDDLAGASTPSAPSADDLQLQADRGAKELLAGRNKNIHETMMSIEKADMSFRLMMQVRNKVIEAYREIMRMQV